MDEDVNSAIEACDALVNRMADREDGLYYDDEAQERMLLLARKIIAQHGNPRLHITVQWWEGCSCHGRTRDESLEAYSIEEMGRELAGCAHADDSTIGAVVWVLNLSEQEQDRLREIRDRHIERNKEIQRLTAWRDSCKKHLAKAADEIQAEIRALAVLRPELTPEAAAKRDEAIAKKMSGRDKIAADMTETETKLVALSAQKP